MQFLSSQSNFPPRVGCAPPPSPEPLSPPVESPVNRTDLTAALNTDHGYPCSSRVTGSLQSTHQLAAGGDRHCPVFCVQDVPLLEDCRRGLHTLLHQAAECSAAYLLSQALRQCPAALPLSWLGAVGTLWRGLMERKDPDIALLQGALLASQYLLPADNWLSAMADNGQQQLRCALGDTAFAKLLGEPEEENRLDDIVMLLALLTLAGKFCCRSAAAPARRPVIRAVQGISGLFFRAVHYWQVVTGIAHPAAARRSARWQSQPDGGVAGGIMHLTDDQKALQRQHRQQSRQTAHQVKNQRQFEAVREQQLGIRPWDSGPVSAGEHTAASKPLISAITLVPAAAVALPLAQPPVNYAIINWPRHHPTALGCLIAAFGLVAVGCRMLTLPAAASPSSSTPQAHPASRQRRQHNMTIPQEAARPLSRAIVAGDLGYGALQRVQNHSLIARFFVRHTGRDFYNRFIHPMMIKIWRSYTPAIRNQLSEGQFALVIYNLVCDDIIFLAEMSTTRNLCLDSYFNKLFSLYQYMWAEWRTILPDSVQLTYTVPPKEPALTPDAFQALHHQAVTIFEQLPLETLKDEIANLLISGDDGLKTPLDPEIELILAGFTPWLEEIKASVEINARATENALNLVAHNVFEDFLIESLVDTRFVTKADDFSFFDKGTIYLLLRLKIAAPRMFKKLGLMIAWSKLMPSLDYIVSNRTRGELKVRLPILSAVLQKLTALYPQPTRQPEPVSPPTTAVGPLGTTANNTHVDARQPKSNKTFWQQYDKQAIATGLMITGALGVGGAIIGARAVEDQTVPLRTKVAGMVSGSLAAGIAGVQTMDAGVAGVASGAAGIASGFIETARRLNQQSDPDQATWLVEQAFPAVGSHATHAGQVVGGVDVDADADADADADVEDWGPGVPGRKDGAAAGTGATKMLNTTVKGNVAQTLAKTVAERISSDLSTPGDIGSINILPYKPHNLLDIILQYPQPAEVEARIGLNPGKDEPPFSTTAPQIFIKLTALQQALCSLIEKLSSGQSGYQNVTALFFQQSLGIIDTGLVERAKHHLTVQAASVHQFLEKSQQEDFANVVLLAPGARRDNGTAPGRSKRSHSNPPYLYAVRQDGVEILAIRSELVGSLPPEHETGPHHAESRRLDDSLLNQIIHLATSAKDYLPLETTYRQPLPPAVQAFAQWDRLLQQQTPSPALMAFIHDYTRARNLPYPANIGHFVQQRPLLRANLIMNNAHHLAAMMRDLAHFTGSSH